MKVTVVTRSGRELINGGLELSDSATVADLEETIHRRTKKYYPSRQRLTLPLPPGSRERPTVLTSKKSLKDYTDGKKGELTVVFKDLGPQVKFSTLFFWEYLGPLILYPIFYYFPIYKFFGYNGERTIHPVQTYALYYWCFHYFKCIMETFFVHHFSHATSPIVNVFRNCAYYWTFGAWIAYFVNHPLYTPVSDHQMMIGFGFGLLCQVSNFYCHILLRNLRFSDSGGYQIPRGFLLNVVTYANYTTEIYQWLGFNIATQTVAGYVFMVVAAAIMMNWVLAKHRRLKKGDYVAPSVEKRKLGTIVFAAVRLPVSEIVELLHNLGGKDPRVEGFLKDKDLKNSLSKAHLTLAHKRSHGVTAVAGYSQHLHQNVPVKISSLLFSNKLAALEAEPGVVDGEKISSRNEWPHVTLWTAKGISAKQANTLPHLLAEGKATRVEINPPVTITGVLEFF